ncbi:hypothetical protein EGH82_23750, partial [Vibrio ponticus]
HIDIYNKSRFRVDKEIKRFILMGNLKVRPLVYLSHSQSVGNNDNGIITVYITRGGDISFQLTQVCLAV